MNRNFFPATGAIGLLLLTACGGGGGYGGGGGGGSTMYAVGGTVTGLTGSGLVLQNNAGNNLPISAAGAFSFAASLASGAAYAVTVITQPSSPTQNCVVSNGSGTVGTANVTNVTVVCGPPPPATTHFAVVTPSSAVAGVPITVTVTALDASNKPVTAYTGTVTFSSSDPLVVRPADTHLTSGTASISATLNTAGSQTITATDSMTASITGRSNATEVSPAGSTDTPTGTMGTARNWHTATILHDGTVLITGGCSDGGSLASAEVFHPATGTFTPTANDMSTSRCSHTATLVNNQQVLVTGGGGTSADLYDPSTERFSPTGNMGISRSAPTATLLKNGTVLITGGQGSGGYLASAEVFDPTTGLFTPTAGNMTTVRWGHAATLMADGRVLVTGGIGTWAVGGGYLQSAEIYDPASRTFTATGSMHYKRWWHTTTLLGDGNVLVVGGEDVFRTVTASAELFDPATGVFMAAAGMAQGRRSHTATLLTDGRVLITGGEWFNTTGGIPSLASAGLYGPSGTTFTPTSNMLTPRSEHTATRLNDGSVLVTGGIDWTSQARTVLASAELYH